MTQDSIRPQWALASSVVLLLLLGITGGPQAVDGGIQEPRTAAFPAEPPQAPDRFMIDINEITGQEKMHQEMAAPHTEGCLDDEPLFCLTCLNAATEAECKQNGTLLQCAGEQAICAVFTMEEQDEVRLYSRMCHTRSDCVTSVLGPSGKYCDAFDEKDVCTYCEFGEKDKDFSCGSVDQAEQGSGPCDNEAGETVWCRACTNVASEDECRTSGSLVECPSAKYICEVTTHETHTGQIKRYSRGCSLRSQCQSAIALFGGPKICTGHKDALNCKHCDYGVEGEDFGCALPAPAEQNPCDEANEESLWCKSCDSAHNATHCQQIGVFRKCPHRNSVCEVSIKQRETPTSTLYSRACQNRTSCKSQSLGPDSKICTGLDQSCSYCEFGQKDSNYKCSAAPCDQAAGESLWCLECSDATSLFDCAMKGTFQECAGQEVACHSEVITTATGQHKHFNRKCMSRTRCPSVQLGVANTVCRQDGENVKCSYCDFGLPDIHYQCKPDVCDFVANETLQCLSCTDASSLTECYLRGEFKACDGDQPVCETSISYLGNNVAGVTRRCGVKTGCGVEGEAGLGSSAAICQNRNGHKVCSYCDYGSLGSTYFCSPASKIENRAESSICSDDDPFGCHTSLESAASRIEIPAVPDIGDDVSKTSLRSKRDLTEAVEEWVVGESGDGSGEDDGSGSGYMGLDEELCSAEKGESPACWTCIKAKSDADCWTHGSFQPCLSPDPVCQYSVTSNSAFGGVTKEVTRQCSSRDVCFQGNPNDGNTVTSDYSVETQCGHETLGIEYICVDPTNYSGRRKRDLSEAPGCFEKETHVHTCHTSDEPYVFNTFDGRSIEFEGDCKYLIASTPPGWESHESLIGGESGEELLPFQVFLKKQRGGREVEYVEMNVGQKNTDNHLVIKMRTGNFYEVNGTEILPSQLPSTHYYTNSRYLSLVPTGQGHVSVRSSHGGVTLGYDGQNWVHIHLPHQYNDRGLQGLCGNLNGVWSDDLTSNTGVDTSSLGMNGEPAAGYSWQIPDDTDDRCRQLQDCGCVEGVCVPHLGICQCPIGRSGQKCQHEIQGVCEAREEPGFHTFDGSDYDFSGPCRYLLAGTSDVIPLHFIQFNVYIEGDNMQTDDESRRTRAVAILYGSTKIDLLPGFKIQVDGKAVESDIVEVADGLILQDGVRVRVITDFGLSVSYDGYYNVKVTVSKDYKGYIAGLCGNMDANARNDMLDSCGNDIHGLQEEAGNALGISWLATDPSHENSLCREKADCDVCHGGLFVGGDIPCRCPVHQAGKSCQYYVSAQCVALGEPHYRTFDGAMLHYRGSCKYLLAGTSPKLPTKILTPFSVFIKNEHTDRDGSGETRTLYAEIHYKGHVVKMDRFFNIEVDGLTVELPHRAITGVDIHVYRGTSVRTRTFFGLSISINHNGRTTVRVPQKYSGYMQGLCGNYNHVQMDDFKTNDGTFVGDDKKARSALVGNSWKQVDNSDLGCLEPFEDDIPNVSKIRPVTLRTHAHCDLLFNTSLGDNPFTSCISRLGNVSLMYMEACVYVAAAASVAAGTDVPSQPSHGSPHTCGVIEAFADECRFTAGVPVPDWRWKTGCSLFCSKGMEASVTVPAVTPSCMTRPVTLYQELSAEGCVCPRGMLLSGTQCVIKSQCGCEPGDGHYHPMNSKWLSHECGAINKCLFGIQQALVMTKPYECPGDAQCIKENGKLACHYDCRCMNGGTCIPSAGKCRCPWNFIGKNCETEVTCCKAWGDPHYLTFSGMTVDFMGSCRYQLTGTCPNATNFEHFKLTAVNQPLLPGLTLLSTVKEVSIELGGHKVDLLPEGGIQVDEEAVSAPVQIDDLSVFRTPSFTVLQTPAVLVRYDEAAVEICLPISHPGRLCGICGNVPSVDNDGNNIDVNQTKESDDNNVNNNDYDSIETADAAPVSYITEDGCRKPSLSELKLELTRPSASWKTEVDEAAHLCGLLHPFMVQGPFGKCWLHLDVTVRSAYHDSCRFDVYALENVKEKAHKMACRILESIAQLCLSMGHVVDFKIQAECRPACPSGQYYQVNTPSCPASCSDPSAPRFCRLPNHDGCACAPGLLLNAENACVSPQMCGCMDSNEKYHKAMSQWYNEDCTVRHTCQPATASSGSKIINGAGCNIHNSTCVVSDGKAECKPNPVDGGWGMWSEWSSCTESPMHPNAPARVRVRSCDSPEPSSSGKECAGASIDHDFDTC